MCIVNQGINKISNTSQSIKSEKLLVHQPIFNEYVTFVSNLRIVMHLIILLCEFLPFSFLLHRLFFSNVTHTACVVIIGITWLFLNQCLCVVIFGQIYASMIWLIRDNTKYSETMKQFHVQVCWEKNSIYKNGFICY